MKTLLSSTLLFVLLTPTAFAAKFSAEEDLQLSESVAEDSYRAGGRVRIDGDTTGDLLVTGGELRLHGNVSEDLAAFGGEVRIVGDVNDDVRAVGGQVSIEGTVDGDVVVIAGVVIVESTARILGDMIVLGGDISIYGPVDGSVQIYTDTVGLYSTIGGDTAIHAGKLRLDGAINGNVKMVSGDLVTTENASIGGDLEYWTATSDVDIESIVAGTVRFNEDLGISASEAAVVGGGIASVVIALVAAVSIYKLLSALLFIIIAVLSTKKFFPDTAKRCKSHPWTSLLFGLLFVVGTPIVAVAFMITIIGMPIGLSILALYVLVLVFAQVFASVVLTYWYMLQKKKPWSTTRTIIGALAVYMLLSIVMIVPVLGWIVAKGLILVALGASIFVEYQRFLKAR